MAHHNGRPAASCPYGDILEAGGAVAPRPARRRQFAAFSGVPILRLAPLSALRLLTASAWLIYLLVRGEPKNMRVPTVAPALTLLGD